MRWCRGAIVNAIQAQLVYPLTTTNGGPSIHARARIALAGTEQQTVMLRGHRDWTRRLRASGSVAGLDRVAAHCRG